MAIDLLDYFMDNGKLPLFIQVSSKDFLVTIINILKIRGAVTIQEKILYMIKKWGIKFEKNRDIIPTFCDFYEKLKQNNTVFPNITTPGYNKYIYSEQEINKNSLNNSPNTNKNNVSIKNNTSNYNKNIPIYNNSFSGQNNNKISENIENANKIVDYSYSNYIDINPEKFQSKFKKFVNELIVWMDNLTLANVNKIKKK